MRSASALPPSESAISTPSTLPEIGVTILIQP
jgi:hypothetical protein